MRRGASFRHLLLLSLPWRGPRGDAPAGAEGEIAKEKGEEPAVPDETGETPVTKEMDEDASEGEVPLPEDEEMNTLRGAAQADGDERSGLAHVRGLDKSKSSHLPWGCLMYPAHSSKPPVETTASVKGRVGERQPIRAV